MERAEDVDSGEAREPIGRALLLLTAAGLLVRVAFLLLEPATRPIADERTWIAWATNLATPRVGFSPLRTHLIFYPPLYPYFIGVTYAAFGTLAAVKWLQAAAGALLVPAVGRVGRAVFGPRAGTLAAAIAAFYPDLVWFSVHFWSETLFLALLWWAFERLLAADAPGRPGVAIAAGLLWGLAILTRETILYFTPVAAVWLAARPRPEGGRSRGALFLLVSLLTVAPWTYRNWLVYRVFVPVSTAGGLNIFQGNALLTRQQVYDRYRAIFGRVEEYQYARRMGIAAILERQPTWIFEKLRDEMPLFWEADSLVLIHIKRGAYGPVRPAAAVVAAVLVLVPYLALLALLVPALAVFPASRPAALLLLFLLYYNAIHVVTHGFARYRLPAMPVLFVMAAGALAAWRQGSLPAFGRLRAALGLGLAVVFVLCLIPSFRVNLSHPAFGLGDREDTPLEETPPP